MDNLLSLKNNQLTKAPLSFSSSLRLNGKSYPLFSAVIFLLIYGIDVLFCFNKQLFNEGWVLGVITVVNIAISLAMNFDKKYYKLIPINCLFNFAAIGSLIILNGFSTGIYFYIVPTVIVFILFTSDGKRKLGQTGLFFIFLIFIATIFAAFKLSLNKYNITIPNPIFIYRLIGTLVFSGILLRLYLPAFINKENLKVRKNYFEALFQSPQHGYIVFNASTKEIVDYNKTLAFLFELPYESTIKGIYITQFMNRYLSTESKNAEMLMDSLPTNWQGEGQFTTHNKNQLSANVNIVSYLKNDDEYKIICIQDITTNIKSQVELLQYKENLENSTKVKTRFLSSISHELRTPLNGIIGTVNLMMDSTETTDQCREQLKLQLFSAEHMLSIVNNILDFSKIQSGTMGLHKHPFELTNYLQNIINSFQNQFNTKKINLEHKIDSRLNEVYVNTDEVKLRQILNNLLSNALKFTIEGKVTFEVLLKDNDDTTVSIEFKITDTGIGISQDKHAEIFEGFTQVHADDLKRRFGGTGLGLAISQKLANLFKTSIQIDSTPGQGACFYFTATLEKHVRVEMLAEEVSLNQLPKPDIRGIRVLIVEDNEINATILKTFLTRWGVRVMEAGHGLQALELLKYHKFDMILMDLEMPEMNGYAATAAIREANNEVPIIAFTATLLESMENLITKQGFNDYILKPFKPAILKSKIEKFAPHRLIEYA